MAVADLIVRSFIAVADLIIGSFNAVVDLIVPLLERGKTLDSLRAGA